MKTGPDVKRHIKLTGWVVKAARRRNATKTRGRLRPVIYFIIINTINYVESQMHGHTDFIIYISK